MAFERDQDEHGAAARLGTLRAAAEGQGPVRPLENLDLVAALRHDRVEAPWFIDGPINGERFRLYVEKVLCPTLKPGDIVIMDNLGSHKGKAVRRAIRAVGARLLFLPKYSPDLNPVEQFFAKLKHFLQDAAKRNGDDLCDAIGNIIADVTPAECKNYFANSGYDEPKIIPLVLWLFLPDRREVNR